MKISSISIQKLFIILIIFFISIYSAFKLKIGDKSKLSDLTVNISFDYFGIDAAQIEQVITIPLEEKLFQLENIKNISSTSENDRSSTTITFNNNVEFESTYLQLSRISEELYNQLPHDVQRPEIKMSNNFDDTVICATFNTPKDAVNKFKYKFDSIQGVSEVKISGNDFNQYLISYENYKSNVFNISPFTIAKLIQDNNISNQTLTQTDENYSRQYFFKLNPLKINKINNITIPTDSSNIYLNGFTKINKSKSDSNELILINNKEQTIITIKANPESDWAQISKSFNKIIKEQNISELSPIIIYDKGKDKLKLFLIYCCIFLTILFIFTILTTLYCRKITFIFLITVIFSISVTCGIYSIFSIIFTYESFMGIILSVPLIYIIFFTSISQRFSKRKTITAITTLFITYIISLIFKTELIVISLFTTGTFLMILSSILFLLIIHNKERLTYKNFNISTKLLLIILYAILIPVAYSLSKSEIFYNSKVLKFTVEFKPERSIDSIKTELDQFTTSLENIAHLKYIKTEIHRGNAEYELVFTKKFKRNVKDSIVNYSSLIKTGSVFFQDKKLSNLNEYKYVLTGNNLDKCQNYVKEISRKLSEILNDVEIILNFKDKEKIYIVKPDTLLLSSKSIQVSELARAERYNINGAIITKNYNNNIETDIKLKSDFDNKLSLLENQKLNINGSLVEIKSIADIAECEAHSKKYRFKSLPAAYFTINTKQGISKINKTIENLLPSLNLEDGYSIRQNTDYYEEKDIRIKLILIIIANPILLTIMLISLHEKKFNIRFLKKYYLVNLLLLAVLFFIKNLIVEFSMEVIYMNMLLILLIERKEI